MSCPPPGDLPDPGIEPVSLVTPALQAHSLPLAPPGKLALTVIRGTVEREIQAEQKGTFLSCGMRTSLTAVVSPVAGHRLQGTRASALAAHGLQSTGPRTVHHRLSRCKAGGIFPDQGLNLYPRMGRRIRPHETTRAEPCLTVHKVPHRHHLHYAPVALLTKGRIRLTCSVDLNINSGPCILWSMSFLAAF